MSQNPRFSVQVLEKVGAPLAAAIESVPLEGAHADIEAAKRMAQMLGQAVQISIALSNTLNLNENEAQAESTRVALAAVASPLLADFYYRNGRVPDDADLKRLVRSLEAVLAFAENFTPAAEDASRLSTIDHGRPLFDMAQPVLTIIQAITPVIAAVSEFPFGQNETKLVQDIANRLEANAAAAAAELGDASKLASLMVFKALADLYAGCHRAATDQMARASDEERMHYSIETVWNAFDTKMAMLTVLLKSSGLSQANAGSPQLDKSIVLQTAPSQNQPVPPSAPAMAPPPAQKMAAPSGGGPMGFFAKKPSQDNAPPPQAPASSPSPVPAPQDNPAKPAAGGGPMSFFKPGANKENGGESTKT